MPLLTQIGLQVLPLLLPLTLLPFLFPSLPLKCHSLHLSPILLRELPVPHFSQICGHLALPLVSLRSEKQLLVDKLVNLSLLHFLGVTLQLQIMVCFCKFKSFFPLLMLFQFILLFSIFTPSILYLLPKTVKILVGQSWIPLSKQHILFLLYLFLFFADMDLVLGLILLIE